MKPIVIKENIQTAMNLLTNNNYEVYLVGGAIRNAFLDLPIHDYDLTTNATPEQMLKVFKDYTTIQTGIKHGTITVVINHENIEITTYRKDTTYTNHRHPDEVHFTTSLEEDCKRRDFTINALAYNPNEGLKDFHNGQQDLQNKIIKAIGDPNIRFEEDALRILRAIRFASRLDFTIDPNTQQAMCNHKNDLKYVSIERIASELKGILESIAVEKAFQTNREILTFILPILDTYSTQTYLTTIHTLPLATTFEERFALLLQPINDPTTIHTTLKNLKYPNKTIKHIETLHQALHLPLNSYYDLKQFKHQTKDYFKQAYNLRYTQTNHQEQLTTLYNKLQTNNPCTSYKEMALNGKDLIALNYKGKEINTTLQTLLDLIMKEELPNNKEALINYLKKT